MPDTPIMTLSHFAVPVADMPTMERFYTETLGFVVTDRRKFEKSELVFMSRSPDEHHQLVLQAGGKPRDEFNHLAFRVDSLTDLRQMLDILSPLPGTAVETVSHGTTWSIYFRDPENNRIEILTPTPWHVEQPLRFEVDYGLSDADLIAATEAHIRDLPGFCPREEWFAAHTASL